jgi:hypothetical protein
VKLIKKGVGGRPAAELQKFLVAPELNRGGIITAKGGCVNLIVPLTLPGKFSLIMRCPIAMSEPKKQWLCPRDNKTYSVDVGHESDWLEALNSFENLYLRSICEGHPGWKRWTATKSMPILRLSITPKAFARCLDLPKLDAQIRELFEASPLPFTSELDHGLSTMGEPDYALHLDSIENRTSENMEPWVRTWFEDSIAFLRHVDLHLSALS